MKKQIIILIVVIVLFVQQGSLAQKKIEIDFKTKSIEKLDPLKDGDIYQLQIKNINMNLYKISYESTDSIITSNVTFPSFDIVGLDELSKIVSKILPLSTEATTSEKDYPIIQFFKSFSFSTIQKSSTQGTNIFFEEMRKFISNINEYEKSLTKKSQEIDSLNLSIQKLALSYLVDRNQELKSKLKSNFEPIKILKESEILRKEIKISIHNIVEKFESYKSFFLKNKTSIESNIELNKINNQLIEAFPLLIASANKLYESINSEKVASWLNLIIQLDNNDTNEFISLPMQLNGDLATMKIKIEPKKVEFGLPTYQTELIFPKEHNLYIGMGMSFYHAGLKNETYSFNSINDSTEYRIVNENHPRGEIGIATLLHFGCKPFNVQDLGCHFSIGPAMSISSTIKTRLAAGIGFAYGKRQMISVDIMAIAGYIDRISNLYNISTVYSKKPEQITVSELNYSWSIGIGYIYKF